MCRVDEGQFTPLLWRLEPSAPLWLDPRVYGRFTLEEIPSDADLLMIGTGTGIAPFVAMLRAYSPGERWRRCLLLESARRSEDLGYRSELEALAAREEVLRERAGLARLGVDVHARQDAIGRELAGFAVAHLVHEARKLVAHLEERRAHRDGVARHELAPVGDVLLHGGHAAPILAQVGGGDAHRGKEVPGRLVELADVPHDVHVAHVVAVPGVDRAAVGLDHAVSPNSSRPISQRRISEVPAPIS